MLIMLAESRHRRCKLSRHPANAGLDHLIEGGISFMSATFDPPRKVRAATKAKEQPHGLVSSLMAKSISHHFQSAGKPVRMAWQGQNGKEVWSGWRAGFCRPA